MTSPGIPAALGPLLDQELKTNGECTRLIMATLAGEISFNDLSYSCQYLKKSPLFTIVLKAISLGLKHKMPFF